MISLLIKFTHFPISTPFSKIQPSLIVIPSNLVFFRKIAFLIVPLPVMIPVKIPPSMIVPFSKFTSANTPKFLGSVIDVKL